MPDAHPFPADATLADVGEFSLVSAFAERFPQGELVYIGPGDDAAVLRTPRGHVVVSTDMLVEQRHFRRGWSSAADIGHRAIAANLSDVNAMGGTATALTVALAAPPDLPARWMLDLADGMAAEAALVGASIVGGDLSAADQITISVTVLGTCDQAPVTRSGAQPGDVLALAGRQGWAAAGLAVLSRGFRSPRIVVDALARPEPPYAAGPLAAVAGATSMIDVSDGLVADAGHLAADSGVRLDIETERLEITEAMRSVGAAIGADPMSFVLGGGDDHPLLATFPADAALPAPFVPIGTVRPGEGVTVDGEAYEGPGGHTHF
ncbi:MAG TPA: thiamine-phosphate kinase [Marmoricola sp.]